MPCLCAATCVLGDPSSVMYFWSRSDLLSTLLYHQGELHARNQSVRSTTRFLVTAAGQSKLPWHQHSSESECLSTHSLHHITA